MFFFFFCLVLDDIFTNLARGNIDSLAYLFFFFFLAFYVFIPMVNKTLNLFIALIKVCTHKKPSYIYIYIYTW